MRVVLPATVFLSTATALQLPETPTDFQPFLEALSLSNQTATTTTAPRLDLFRRQATFSADNACPTSFVNCANLGAANLCCDSNAVCSADYAGHVACCRSGAACSGTISNIITAGTVSNGVLVGGGAATTSAGALGAGGLMTAGSTTTTDPYAVASSTAAQNTNGLVVASATTASTVGAQGSGFVLDGDSTVATPGFGLRQAEVPLVARAILKALQYLPI